MALQALPLPPPSPERDNHNFGWFDQADPHDINRLLEGRGTDFLLRSADVTLIAVTSQPRDDFVPGWTRYGESSVHIPSRFRLDEALPRPSAQLEEGGREPTNALVAERLSITEARMSSLTWRRVAGDENLTPSDQPLEEPWIIYDLVRQARHAITSPPLKGNLINGGVEWVPRTLPLGWITNEKPGAEPKLREEPNSLYVAVHPDILPITLKVIDDARDAHTLAEKPPGPGEDYKVRTAWQEIMRQYIKNMEKDGPAGIERLAETVVAGIVIAGLPGEAKKKYIRQSKDIEELAA